MLRNGDVEAVLQMDVVRFFGLLPVLSSIRRFRRREDYLLMLAVQSLAASGRILDDETLEQYVESLRDPENPEVKRLQEELNRRLGKQ